ncbi:TetR/AcrR family transcriptional regulator [Nocardia wallacei]|uniref:Putative transcriptional regulator, TetR family protein n=1 Tax=Nocardia wallacei TaxID=480035 RepID=A0A7G1KT95_9NOCA|nr:TetR/AcrR family transcriptional regulator [Nocardia wallacei]BCK56414.1 putative transcriptional regulator, TetR family protein [Nocardia wallacei]
MTRDTLRPRGRPPGPAPDPIRRRAEILDAAERVIARAGTHMTIAQVAAEAGYARTAVYAVFPDLPALIDALAQRHMEGIITAADAVLAQPLPARELLRAVVRLMCDFVEDNPNLHHVMMQRLDSGETEHRPFFARVSDWATAVFDVILRRLDADPALARIWATATVGAILMSAEAWAQDPDLSREQFIDRLAAFLWPTVASIGGERLIGPISADELATARGLADNGSSS